jgi:phosphate transport system substrate-binding protein
VNATRRVLASVCLLVIVLLSASIVPAACGKRDGEKVVKVSGAYALYPMMARWAEEYQRVKPGVKIEVSGGGAGKGMADALAGMVAIGMVSREIRPEEIQKGAFFVSCVKDAVVATIHAKNPVLAKLRARGVTRAEFEKIFLAREIKTWGELVGDSAVTDRIKVYTRADSCGAAETWAKYLGKYAQEDLTRSADAGIMNDPDLAAAVAGDPLAIGYNNINFAYDARTGAFLENMAVAPIDVNGNGKVDPEEDFYATQKDLLEAIGNGKYPSPPARDLNLVGKGRFTGEALAFVNWILTEGQKYVAASGYIPLPPVKIAAELSKVQ